MSGGILFSILLYGLAGGLAGAGTAAVCELGTEAIAKVQELEEAAKLLPPDALPDGHRSVESLPQNQRQIALEAVSTQPERMEFSSKVFIIGDSYGFDAYLPPSSHEKYSTQLARWRLVSTTGKKGQAEGLVEVEMQTYGSEMKRLREGELRFTIFEPELALLLSEVSKVERSLDQAARKPGGKKSKVYLEQSQKLEALKQQTHSRLGPFFSERVRSALEGKSRGVPLAPNALAFQIQPPESLPKDHRSLESLSPQQREIAIKMVSTQPERLTVGGAKIIGDDYNADTFLPPGPRERYSTQLARWRFRTPDSKKGSEPTGLVELEISSYTRDNSDLVRLRDGELKFTVFEPELATRLAEAIRLDEKSEAHRRKRGKDNKDYKEMQAKLQALQSEVDFLLQSFLTDRVHSALTGESLALPPRSELDESSDAQAVEPDIPPLPEGHQGPEAFPSEYRDTALRMVSTEPQRLQFSDLRMFDDTYTVDSFLEKLPHEEHSTHLGRWKLRTPDGQKAATPTGYVEIELNDYWTKGDLVRLREGTAKFSMHEPQLAALIAKLEKLTRKIRPIEIKPGGQKTPQYKELDAQREALRNEINFRLKAFFSEDVFGALSKSSP